MGIEHYKTIGTVRSQVWFYDPDGNGIEIMQLHQQQSKL